MVVGICRIAFMLPHNDSLKGKRSVIRKILERSRARFNVAAAEVDSMDDKRRAVLGFAVVSNDRRHANAMLDTIASFAEGSTQAVVVDRALELIQVGALDGSQRFVDDPDVNVDTDGVSDEDEAVTLHKRGDGGS